MGKIFTPTDSDFSQTDAVVIGGGALLSHAIVEWRKTPSV